jgi:hypothetical protein
MKHEHAMCRANDIKQKRLLGGNPAHKNKKKIRFAFFFLFFYFLHFTLFLSFSSISTLRTMLRLKCGDIERILVFFIA